MLKLLYPLKIFLSHLPKSKLFYPIYLAKNLNLVELEYKSDRLPLALDDFRILYISDIHYGSTFNKKGLTQFAGRINAQKADIILLGGDYGDNAKSGKEFFDFLPKLSAKHGVYACLGNHDLIGTKSQVNALMRSCKAKNIKLVVNKKEKLKNLPLILSSVDDIKKGFPDYSILKGKSDSCFHIFFPHSPDVMPEILKSEKRLFDLALCGHTHAGQLRVFGRTLHSSSKYGERYRYGWKKEKHHDIFISSGVGSSLLPLRLGTKAEFYILTLKKA